jgi:hypothetical protein
MAFTVFTTNDSPQGSGTEFGDSDEFAILDNGVLIVHSKTAGTIAYSSGYWQRLAFRDHPEIKRRW